MLSRDLILQIVHSFDLSERARHFTKFSLTRYQVALAGLLVFSLGLYIWQFDSFQVGVWTDDAKYIVLAKSIVAGHGYGLIYSSGDPLPTDYPFGWPLILSAACGLFGCGFEALKTVSLIFSLANVALVARGWKYLGIPNEAFGLGVAALYALSRFTSKYAGMVMSEPAFTFFVLLCLILTVKEPEHPRAKLVNSLALGIVWMFVAYIRTIGITLVAASAIWLLWRKRPARIAWAIAGFSVAIGATLALTDIRWQDLNAFAGYFRQFVERPRTPQSDVASYVVASAQARPLSHFAQVVTETLIPFIHGSTIENLLARLSLSFLSGFASVFVATLVVIGFLVVLWRQGFLPSHLFILMYAGVLTIWGLDERFFYPTLPLLFTYLLVGGGVIFEILGKVFMHKAQILVLLRPVAIVIFVMFVFLQLISSLLNENSLLHARDFRVGTDWLREHTPPDAIIVADEPWTIYLYSGRATVEPRIENLALKERDPQKDAYVLVAPALAWNADGKLEYDQSGMRLLAALQSGKLRGTVVFEDDRAKVLVYRLE